MSLGTVDDVPRQARSIAFQNNHIETRTKSYFTLSREFSAETVDHTQGDNELSPKLMRKNRFFIQNQTGDLGETKPYDDRVTLKKNSSDTLATNPI